LLERLGFNLWHETCDARRPDGRRVLLAGLEEFREHLGGELTITLLRDIGTSIDVHAMDHDLLDQAIEWLRPQDGV
jgi:3-dehydroquinate synthase